MLSGQRRGATKTTQLKIYRSLIETLRCCRSTIFSHSHRTNNKLDSVQYSSCVSAANAWTNWASQTDHPWCSQTDLETYRDSHILIGENWKLTLWKLHWKVGWKTKKQLDKKSNGNIKMWRSWRKMEMLGDVGFHAGPFRRQRTINEEEVFVQLLGSINLKVKVYLINYIADRKNTTLYRQSFFCSAVLTPLHYHWYAATRSPSSEGS